MNELNEIIMASGTVGAVIGVLSLAAIALIVEQFLSLRMDKLLPPGLAEQLRELLGAGRVREADTLCRENPSCLSFIVSNGLSEADGDWDDVEKALEGAAAEQSAKLFRKVEFLSVIGNIAPMVGLLGTVVGMITAFHTIAQTQGSAQAPELAGGIYHALVTTVEGLVVAIPALAAFAFFRSRVDQLMADVTFTVQHVFGPFKRMKRGAAYPVTAKPVPVRRSPESAPSAPPVVSVSVGKQASASGIQMPAVKKVTPPEPPAPPR